MDSEYSSAELQERAFSDWVARLRAMDDATQAFAEASSLVDAQVGFRHRAAELRAELAERIRDGDELSIRQLAARLGVSKTRAVELLKRASL